MRRIVLLILLAWGLRVAAGWWWQGHLPQDQRFGFGDSESYWQLAQAIARGEPYEYPTSDFHIFRAPGYPLLLAPLWMVAGGEPAVLLARAYTALLSALGVGGVFWLGRELFNTRVGWLAALAAALDPGLIGLGALVLSDGPFCALLPFQFVAWTKAWKTQTPASQRGGLLLTGMIAGCATLIRPSWLLFTPAVICLGLACSRERIKHLQAAPWLLLGLAIPLAPWCWRNYQVAGQPVLTTLQVGASLYDGLNPAANGGSNMDFTLAAEAELRTADQQDPLSNPDRFESRLNQKLRQAAIDWAAAHPGDAFRLAGIKFLRMWNIWPNEPQFRKPLVRLAILVSYLPVLVLGVFGLWRFRQQGWPLLVLGLPACYFTLMHMIFVSSLRYRLPAMLLLTVPAAAALVEFISPSTNRNTEPQEAGS